MTLWEGVVALMTIAGVGWIVFVAVGKKNPGAAQGTVNFIKRIMEEKPKPKFIPDRMQQVYPDRGGML